MFRESLVNHLLLAGIERVIEVRRGRDVIAFLPSLSLALVIIDFDLFRDAAVGTVARRYQREYGVPIIVTIDDARLRSDIGPIIDHDLNLCVPKSTAGRVLAALVCQ